MRAIAAAPVLLGLAIAGAATAAADDFNGTYAYRPLTADGAGEFSSVWTVTPCGDDCLHIRSSSGATDADAHRDGANWVFDRFVDPGIECPGNSYNLTKRKLATTMRFRINPDTLMGQYQPVGTPCGGTPVPTAFALTKTQA